MMILSPLSSRGSGMRTSSLAMAWSQRLRFETIETCRFRNSSLGQDLDFSVGAAPRVWKWHLEFGNVATLALGGVVQCLKQHRVVFAILDSFRRAISVTTKIALSLSDDRICYLGWGEGVGCGV